MTTVARSISTPLPQKTGPARLVPASLPPCHYDQPMWDLDASSFADVRHAAKLCATKCARIVECRADLNRLVSTGDAPRSQVMAAQTFSKHGKQLETEIAILGHMNSVAAGHEGNKNAVSEPAAQEQTDQDARVYEMRRTLKALDSEVETDAGTQFALDLGA